MENVHGRLVPIMKLWFMCVGVSIVGPVVVIIMGVHSGTSGGYHNGCP